MTERVLVVAVALLVLMPASIFGWASSGRFVEQREGPPAAATLHSHAPVEAVEAVEADALAPESIADEDVGFDVWTFGRRVLWSATPAGWLHARLTGQEDAYYEYQGVMLPTAWDATKDALPSMLALAQSLPNIAAAVWERPSVLLDLGEAMVVQTIDSAVTFATAKSDAEAAAIAGAWVSDWFVGKALALAGVGGGVAIKKARPMVKLSKAMTRVRAVPHQVAEAVERWLPKLEACFVAGTKVHAADGLVAIETLALGDRVATTGMALAEPTVVDATWKRISLEMARGPGDIVEIELLRSTAWVEQARAVVGGKIALSIPEMDLHGTARVKAVRPARITRGAGQLVLATFESTAQSVVQVRFEGTDEVLSATSRHRLFSLDAKDFVPAGALRRGERMQTHDGVAVVASVTVKPGAQRVYNLEVEGDHSYFVGHVGVLSHNENPYYPRVGGAGWGRNGNGPPGIVVDERRGLVVLAHDDHKVLPRDGESILLLDAKGRQLELTPRQAASDADVRDYIAGLAGEPRHYWRTKYGDVDGIVTVVQPALRTPPTRAVEALKWTVAHQDVRIIDFVSGVRARAPNELRVNAIHTDTYEIVPVRLNERAHEVGIVRTSLTGLPNHMSDRVYAALQDLRAHPEKLAEHLAWNDSRVPNDSMVASAVRRANLVLTKVGDGEIHVEPASRHAMLDPVLMIPDEIDPSAWRQDTRGLRFALAQGDARTSFPRLDAMETDEARRITDALRRVTPTYPIADEALAAEVFAAYREQVAIAYGRLDVFAEPSPRAFRTAGAYADAVMRGFGRRVISQLEAQQTVLKQHRVDIGHPYGDARYAERLDTKPLGHLDEADEIALGEAYARQTSRIANETDRVAALRSRLMSYWRSARRLQ